MNSYLPPTITPVDDTMNVQLQQINTLVEQPPVITPVEEEPVVQYVEEPQIQYVEAPPQIEYVPEPQPVIVPPPPMPVQDDLSKYYAILDQFGPVEPDDDFQLDGWKQFYPLDDPFFN